MLLLTIGTTRAARAQAAEPPAPAEEPRLAAGGEIIATYGSDDPGFFNYATYGYSPFRNLRVVLDASARASRRVSVLAQARLDGGDFAQMTALFVRIRPWLSRRVDLQIGRVPHTVGLLGRVGYGGQEPFVGRPLAYGYLTSLRHDAVARTADDLLIMRGRGWLSSFPLGNTTRARGLPVIDADNWDTGVQARVGAGPVEVWTSVTRGSLANPRLRENNGRVLTAARVTLRPVPSLTLGTSAADGGYMSRSVDAVLTDGRRANDFDQRVLGGDVVVESGRWRFRGEVLRVWWTTPVGGASSLPSRLTSLTAWSDLRVQVLPSLDAAVRVDRLDFGDIAARSGSTPWESPVTRVEAAVSARLHRHLRAKFAVQRNRRPLGGRIRHDTLLAGQLAVWF